MGAWSGHARGHGDVTRVGDRLDCRLPRSTVAYFRQHLGARFASGGLTRVAGVSASIHAGKAARRLGMPTGTLSELAPPDFCLRVIVDDTRLAGRLAERVRLLFEVVPRECDKH